MHFRPFNPEKDKEAVQRIWLETGWIEKDNKEQAEAMELLISAGRALVAEIDGSAECLVLTAPEPLDT